MSETLTTNLTLTAIVNLVNTTTIADASAILNRVFNVAILTNGTGLSKADKIWWSGDRSLLTATSETISMYNFAISGGAAGVNPFGNAVVMATVKALVIVNKATTAAYALTIGGEGSGAAWNSPFAGSDSASLTLGPGEAFALSDPSIVGLAVANTTNHLLKIANGSAGTITYDIVVIGASA